MSIFATKYQTVAQLSLCAVLFSSALIFLPWTPEISPDSVGYLQFAPDRTAGYPIFLSLIGSIDPRLSILPLVQLLFLCASTQFLAIAINRLTNCFVCSIAAIALILGNYEVVKYSFRVMTDVVFISLLATALGCLAVWFVRKKLWWMGAASALIGAATAVRPAGYALFVMYPLLYGWAWGWEKRRVRLLVTMIVPSALVLSLSLVAYHQRHHTWQPSSVLGYNLLGKAISFADGTEQSDRPELIVAAAKMGKLYRPWFEAGETWADRVFLAAPVYDDIRRNLSVGIGIEPGTTEQADHVFMRLARNIITAHIWAYLHNVADNYVALWYIPELMTAGRATRLHQRIDGLAQPMSTSIEHALASRPWPVILVLRMLQFAFVTISIGFLMALPVQLLRFAQPDATLWFGFTVSSALHASLVVVAAINESKPRLMLDNWPMMVLIFALALGQVIQWLDRRKTWRTRQLL